MPFFSIDSKHSIGNSLATHLATEQPQNRGFDRNGLSNFLALAGTGEGDRESEL